MRNRPLAVARVAAIAALSTGLLAAPWLRAQSAQAGNAPAFEAASIKPNKSNDGRVQILGQPGGRFSATGVTLRMLIGLAYGTPQQRPDSQIIGGPSWIADDRFDVVAKAEGDVRPAAPGAPTPMALMMRTLLAERFKLVVHSESRELPLYALVLARGDGKLGPQLRPSAVDCAALRGRGPGGPPVPPPPGERPMCGMRLGPGNLSGGGQGTSQLATVLSRFADRVVLDRTGLTGSYDVDLTWTPDRLPQRAPGTPADQPLRVNGVDIDPNGPSLFTAIQEQLGLKLDSQRGPVDVIIVDSAEHPTED